MTILTQTRWQCDFCRNVSPIIENGNPPGWVYYDRNEQVDIPKLGSIPSLGDPYGPPMLHFCCVAHCERYVEEAE